MLSCSIRFSAPSFWMGGGLESCCVGRVYGADGAKRHHLHRTQDLYSGSLDNHPSKNSVQKTISAPYTRPTQRLSRQLPIQKLGAENHMLQLNI